MKKRFKLLCSLLMILLSLLLLASCMGDDEETVHEHTYDQDWTVVKEATCAEEGLVSKTCSGCGEVTEKTVEKTDVHTPSQAFTLITEPTEDTDGLKTCVCTVCSETVEIIIPKHAHEFSAEWNIITPATETKDGSGTNTCDICKITVTRAIKYCLEHSFSEDWKVITRPTLTSNGKSSNICDSCGASVTKITDKLTITELQVKTPPVNTYYFSEELFNAYGLVITTVLSDGTTQDIKRGWEVLPNRALNKDDKFVTIKYADLTVDIPVTVSPAVICSVNNALRYDTGSLLYIKGYCVGSCTAENGTIQYLIKDITQNSFIILSEVDYAYKANDRIELYATVESDAYGKYLVYADENESAEKTVVSSGNVVSFTQSSGTTLLNASEAEDLFIGKIQRYDCPVFSNRFYIVKDGNDYILHFNEFATDKESATLENGKTIRLSVENIDESSAIANLSKSELTTYPGALVSGSLTSLYIGSDANNYYMQILDPSWILTTPYTPGEEYLKEIAYAFYYQLPYVDYDQYNTRRNINPAPEDATTEQRIYLDCSSYVNAIYYNAFGVNILPYAIKEKSANTNNFMAYARNNPDAVEVLGYWECRDYTDAEEQKAILAELLKQLRVGDVIVYRKGTASTLTESSGHALIYVGEGKILHCMNTTSYEHNGTNPDKAYDTVSTSSIGFESTYNLFENPIADRYLFNKNYVNFTVLRPLNRGLTPTEQAEARMDIPSLTIEKSVDKHMYSAVYENDLLTYTIGLTNNTNRTITGVNLVEYVPEGTEFVEAESEISHENGKIYWSGDILPEETRLLRFTVKVSADAGNLIESNKGTVNGLNLNKITNTVSKISAEKLEELKDAGKDLANNSATFNDPIDMINALYNSLLGKDVLNYASVTEALNDIIDVENKAYNKNCAIDGMVMENLSGGYLIKGSNPLNNDRIRAIRIEYISIGDVIIAEHSTSSDGTAKRQVAFVYLGNCEFLKIDSTTDTCTVEVLNANSSKKIQNLLTSLYSYEKYAIIRPSLVNESK